MSRRITLLLVEEGEERVVYVGEEGRWTEVLLGRSSGADLFLNDPAVSRRHCRVFVRPRSIAVEDLGSRSGTRLNDRKLSRPTGLKDGDTLRLGEVHLRVRLGPEEETGLPTRTEADGTVVMGAVPPRPPAAAAVEHVVEGRNLLILGRHADCDITLDSPVISRRHAELRRQQGTLVLRDLGSTNGTFLNGQRVSAPRPVSPGDAVKIGPFRLEYDGVRLHSPSPAAGTRIGVAALTKEVNDRETGKPINLLTDISLTILPREFVGLLGSSGCGKSTFMDAVNGRRPATSGTVTYNGENLYNRFDAFKRGIGYVPQELIFHQQLPLADVLRYASRLRLPEDTTDDEIERNIDRVLGIVGLGPQRGTLVTHLSGGQKKRVSIAIELLSRPTLLFLDEATSGLDLGTEAQMMQLFRELADAGVTTMCITHYVDSLEMCDLVAYFVKGRLAYYGPPSELKSYFGVNAMREVYLKEQERTAEDWEQAFRDSDAYRRYVAERGGSAGTPEPTLVRPGQAIEKDRPSRLGTQFKVLTRRYVQILCGDRKNLFLTLCLAPAIGLLVSLVLAGRGNEMVHELARRQGQICFISTLVMFFLGIFGSIREVVKELPIYRHERFINLEIPPYLISKAVPLAVIGAIQTIELLIVLHLFADVRANIVGQFLVLLPLTLGAMWLGLAISAAVDSADKAIMLMILVIIPQLLFANAFIELTGAGEIIGFLLVPAYWCHDGLKSLLPDNLLEVRIDPRAAKPLLFGHKGWVLDFFVLWLFVAFYAALAFHFLRRKDGPRGRPYAIRRIRSGVWIRIRTRAAWLGGRVLDRVFSGVRRIGSAAEKMGEREPDS